MNPFLNPIKTIPFIKYIYYDPWRIYKIKEEKLKKIKDNALRKIVKYAYTVPYYHEKYKKLGIHPDNIRGIDDIDKLPFITKNELINNFPDRVIPKLPPVH